MALPSRPVRRSTQVGVNSQGNPVAGQNASVYRRKSAQAFGSVDKGVYRRSPVGLSPKSVPINDKDAGSDQRKYR